MSYHNNKVDKVLDTLHTLSTDVIQSMDNNIALMGNIIKLHETLSKNKNGSLDRSTYNSIVNQTDFNCKQMHLTQLRTKYFEAQVNILAAHTTFNSLCKDQQLGEININGDDDINWRATEATLENLYLEYHYHTIKFQELLKLSHMHKEEDSDYDEDVEYNNLYSTPLNKTDDKKLLRKKSKAILLKPLKTSAKRQSRVASENSPFDSSVNMDSPLTPLTPIIPQHKDNLPQRNLNQVLQSVEMAMADTNKVHKRANSVPETPKSQISLGFGQFDQTCNEEPALDKNVRHFISYDTGLNKYIENDVSLNWDNSSIIKESELVGSYEESFESVVFTEQEPSILQRSTSNDSIFQLHPPVKKFGSERSIWMDHLNQKLPQLTVDISNVTVKNSFNGNNRASLELSTVVKQAEKKPTDNFFKNFDDFLTSVPRLNKKKPVMNSMTSKELLNAVLTNNYIDKLEQNKTAPIPVPKSAPTYTEDISSTFTENDMMDPQQLFTHQFRYTSSDEPQFPELKSQWTQFISRLNPHNLIPPSSFVTSETGKPVAPLDQESSTIVPTRLNKGSYVSTLTIGPHHSKIIHYGTETAVGHLKNVLSTRVSQTALNDALNDASFY